MEWSGWGWNYLKGVCLTTFVNVSIAQDLVRNIASCLN